MLVLVNQYRLGRLHEPAGIRAHRSIPAFRALDSRFPRTSFRKSTSGGIRSSAPRKPFSSAALWIRCSGVRSVPRRTRTGPWARPQAARGRSRPRCWRDVARADLLRLAGLLIPQPPSADDFLARLQVLAPAIAAR
jgi:hypothetical protein